VNRRSVECSSSAHHDITHKTLVRNVGRLERALALQLVHRASVAPHAVTGLTAQGHGIADIIAEVLAQQPELIDSPRTPPRHAERPGA